MEYRREASSESLQDIERVQKRCYEFAKELIPTESAKHGLDDIDEETKGLIEKKGVALQEFNVARVRELQKQIKKSRRTQRRRKNAADGRANSRRARYMERYT